MEKTFEIEVDIKESCLITAKNKEKAIQIVKDNFKELNDIELVDSEIKCLGEVKP